MALILTIAWRNILRHKGKSLIIGFILFFGVFIMTLGCGIIAGLNQGFQKNIVNGFTGDVVILSDQQISDTIWFGMGGRSIEMITDYPKVKKALTAEPMIAKFTPAASGFVMVLDEEGDPGFQLLLGVNFNEYHDMFHNLTLVEGRLLKQNERGILLTVKSRNDLFENNYLNWYVPENSQLVTQNLSNEAKTNIATLTTKDSIVFMGFSDKNSAVDIRSSIKGIVKYSALNTFWGHFNILDIESFRECSGYLTASEQKTTVDEQKKTLLTMDNTNLDNLFLSEAMITKSMITTQTDQQIMTPKTTTQAIAIDVDTGVYNQVFIRLKPGIKIDAAVRTLNTHFQQQKIPARAVTWNQALGSIAQTALFMKGALYLFVGFIFFVAVIIIMNTLSMAALERYTEIGMMRAVGARKGFITWMFLCETLLLTFAFGLLGMVTGIIGIKGLASLKLTTTNEMLQLFYGGDVFHPIMQMQDIFIGIIFLVIVALISMIYPIIIARNITPLQAIARD